MQGTHGSILQHIQDKQLTMTVYKACPREGGEVFFDSLSRIAGFLLRCEVTLIYIDYGGLKWTTL
jgi:hypothetical protein